MPTDSALRPPIHILPLGGLGEVGMNMMLIEGPDTSVLVDCGLTFPKGEYLGADVVIPDTTLLQSRRRPDAILLTHGHEDHIGALQYWVGPTLPPIYATPYTMGAVRSRLEPLGLDAHLHTTQVRLNHAYAVGSWEVEFFPVDHSIPDAAGIILRTPTGTIVHTGDFRQDPTAVLGAAQNQERLQAVGREGVMALLSDSTNALIPGHSASDASVWEGLVSAFAAARGRIFCTLFSTQIARMVQVVRLAQRFGRKLAIAGSSLERNIRLAIELKHMAIPADMWLSIDEVRDLPDSAVCFLVAGSQGETRSALGQMAAGTHPSVSIRQGDAVFFSSRVIPGNEWPVLGLRDQLLRKGAHIFSPPEHAIHGTGHAAREELAWMIDTVRPKSFVPIHGTFEMLAAHSALAQRQGVAHVVMALNGDLVAVEPESCTVDEHLEVGTVYVDSDGRFPVPPEVLGERRKMKSHGLVEVLIFTDASGTQVVRSPEPILRGLPASIAGTSLRTLASQALAVQLPVGTAGSAEVWREVAVSATRRALLPLLGRRAHVEVTCLPYP